MDGNNWVDWSGILAVLLGILNVLVGYIVGFGLVHRSFGRCIGLFLARSRGQSHLIHRYVSFLTRPHSGTYDNL